MMLLTAGTRGDVEPFLALARRAAAEGHEVRLGVPDDSGADLSGIDAVSLNVLFRGLIPDLTIAPWSLVQHAFTEVRPAMSRMFAASVRETVAFAPDVVVHHPLVLSAPLAADGLAIPRVLVEFSPVATPSAQFPASGGPTATRDLGRYNRSTYAVPRAAARLFRSEVGRAAALLPGGLAPTVRTPSRATLMAVSPQLLPRPSDWSSRVHLTGAWFEESTGTAAEPAVADFLRGGRYLVASFGSMVAGDAGHRSRIVVAAARAHGLRALLLTGWGGLELSPELCAPDVLAVRSAALEPVLRGASVVLHHGGAGTAHAVARAGVPSVVVPFTADQPFWGARMHRLGVAAEPVPARRLTVDTLVPAITDALGRRARALEVERAMRTEDGVRRAVDVIGGTMRDHPTCRAT
ncbi:glycosyltransferase [uncultured Amnibacterium sp.]|uniref:glycosyltransferase n=1 Tax=uncultured Amnibacterium sp. TaxID=1631851 RepID=UPI0035CBFC73